MELLLVRHGIAESRASGPDAERALTDEGRDKTRRVALFLQRIKCRPQLVGASPLLRAKETAEIIAKVLCPDARLEVCPFLACGATAEDIGPWVKKAKAECVMAVGHAPDMGDIASAFLCGDTGLDITFKKAAVCCISFSDAPAVGRGNLEWLMQPRQLCAIS